MTRTVALIVAGGRGRRFGAPQPKQYARLAGKAVLRHAVERFLGHPAIARVQVVAAPEDAALLDEALRGLALPPPAPAGGERQGSVRNGLEALAADAPERVLIHDAVRPLVDAGTIDRVSAALDRHAGALAALPVVDSLFLAPDGRFAAPLPREGAWRAQTPQGFRFADILAAHRSAGPGFTDDAQIARAAGLEVTAVMGSEDNLKITTADDLARAERLLAGRLADVRVGNGYDVHRFGPGDAVMLCGVRLPHGQALAGHSDADVALHALTDAILGALAAGDIGQHFAPSDPRWRGADSAKFVRHAVGLLAARGGLLAHADLTIVCEAPRIGPHRTAMRDRLADLLGVDADRVSVKATTTERLGFTGRGEGIAAMASVTVRLP